MPELPELEVVQEALNRRLLGQTIMTADAIMPGTAIVIRVLTGAGFGPLLTGARFESVMRRGQFLVLTLEQGGGSLWLVINPQVTGRLQLCEPKAKQAGPVHAGGTAAAGSTWALSIRSRRGRCSSRAGRRSARRWPTSARWGRTR